MFNSFPIPKPDSGGSFIKSHQTGIVSWTDTTTTKDIPINLVDPKNSIIRVNIYSVGNSMYVAIAPTFVDATSIRLTRNTGGNLFAETPIWEVIEFSDVKSKQIGVKTTASTTEELVTVSPINEKNSILFIHNTSTLNSLDKAGVIIGHRIASPTTLGFQSNTANTIYWQLIEFR